MKKLSLVLTATLALSCSPNAPENPAPEPQELPSILLVTLDTTRADSLGFESGAAETPNLDALAARGLRFAQAYTTAPMTLPAHASMLTGLYPSEHGIRENARYLGEDHVLLASRLREAGYATAAFVSGLPLSRQFGLARGFTHYDDDFGTDAAERGAAETTDRALARLAGTGEPAFVWVHYFDPHEPYAPPEPFRSRSDPYLGEIAYMDRELGRLLAGFEDRFRERPYRVLVVGDHGEGRGEHGEALHGNLLYQGVMRVPMLIAGTAIGPGVREEPVSVRRVFDTVLGWAGLANGHGLVDGPPEVVLGEAMKPFLQYGWQPQVMAVHGSVKVIRSGETEVYDIREDPEETRNLEGRREPGAELREALRSYPLLPAPDGDASPDSLSQEDREKLASLGYADWQGEARLRSGAPSPKDMTHLFGDLDAGSGFFVRQEYEAAIPIFEKVFQEDPANLMVALRLAVAHSVLGRDERAMAYFERARQIAPDSVDVRHYLALHYFRTKRWHEADPLLAEVLERMPRRLPALECLAQIRESQGRLEEAASLVERIAALRKDPLPSLLKLGELKMAVGDTPGAIDAFEQARGLVPEEFTHHLELGVCYLANHRYAEARDALDQVAPDHPGYAMALFKRAQVSVLLGEPDREERIRLAYERADATTRPLIERERLFQGIELR